MNILIVCSSSFYNKIEEVKKSLENKNYIVHYPNCYNDDTNDDTSSMSESEYISFFKEMYYQSKQKISNVDSIIVINGEKTKDGIKYNNYIGASTFLEMYEAFMQNKKIYILNDLPDNMLYDEVKGFNPILLHGNLNNIK